MYGDTRHEMRRPDSLEQIESAAKLASDLKAVLQTSQDLVFRHESPRLSDIQRARFDLLLEEYRALRREIVQRLNYQQRITNYQLVALGVLTTLGAAVFQSTSTEAPRFYLLLSPLVFLLMSWTFSNHDFMIATMRAYIRGPLHRRLSALVEDFGAFEYEEFLTDRRKEAPKAYGPLILFGQEFLLQLAVPPAAIALYLSLFFYDDLARAVLEGHIQGWRAVQWTLLPLIIILYVATVGLRVRLAASYFELETRDLFRELYRALRT